jgi:hypothetical protein
VGKNPGDRGQMSKKNQKKNKKKQRKKSRGNRGKPERRAEIQKQITRREQGRKTNNTQSDA